MSQSHYFSFYENRCRCKEEFSIVKKRKRKRRSKRTVPLAYPDRESKETRIKTFQIRYHNNLSSTAKLLFNSFQNKYLYYAIDDILYSLKSNPRERNNLLAVLYSSVLWLQNNFFVNFFDIWIDEIFIDEISKSNRFLQNDTKIFKNAHSITIQFSYKIRVPVKKQESLW
jgi:hypothetical protein